MGYNQRELKRIELQSEVIPIGRQGDNDVVEIQFDVAKWREEFGEGQFELVHKRNGDDSPYPCYITEDEATVYWRIHSADVEKVGSGKAQLTYFVDGHIAKSAIYTTSVLPSLEGSGDPPEPWESWVTQVLTAGAEAVGARNEAIEAKNDAEDAAEASAESAEQSAEAATEAVKTKFFGLTADAEALEPDEDPTAEYDYEHNKIHFGIPAGGGASSWNDLEDKPFKTLGETLQVDDDGVLNIVIPPEYGRVSYNGVELTVE